MSATGPPAWGGVEAASIGLIELGETRLHRMRAPMRAGEQRLNVSPMCVCLERTPREGHVTLDDLLHEQQQGWLAAHPPYPSPEAWGKP